MRIRTVLGGVGRLAMAGVYLKGGWDGFNEPGARPCPASVAKTGLPSRKHSGAGHMRSSNRGK